MISDVLSRLPFARGSVEDDTSSSSANLSIKKRESTGSSIAVVQPKSFTVSRPTTGLVQRLVTEPIPNVTVASDTAACAGLS